MVWKDFANIFRSSRLQVASETSNNMASGASSDLWITRCDETNFSTNVLYCGVVESTQSRRAATLIIAQNNNGIPLMHHEVWNPKKTQFGRVLLLVDRLRSSRSGPEYRKETAIFEVLQEGEEVMVEIKNSKQSPDNIYKYFANLAYKNEGIVKSVHSILSITDPLRGVVDSMVVDAAVIRFGTYDGRIAKAVLTIENLYYKGEKLKKHLPLGSVASTGTQVFLEVTKWINTEVKQEWEKLLFKEGVIFRASLVWLTGDPKPSKSGGSERHGKPKGSHNDGASLNVAAGNYLGKSVASSHEIPITGCHLTNLHAYYGIVETITSGIGAVVCTAHRNGEPLTWKDDWLAKGVYLERVFLMSDHVRPSKNEPEYLKGTQIKQILKTGDPLRIVVEPTERRHDKGYKWFGKTCWKVDKEESEPFTVHINSLPGHLCGSIKSLISHSIGIINFKTYHGMSSAAFFTHDNFYQDGMKIMKHLPLGSELTKGEEVFLVVDKWNPGYNPNEYDQELIQNNVHFRATLVWNRASSKPENEGSSYDRKDPSAFGKPFQKHVFQQRGVFEKRHPSEVRSEITMKYDKFARGKHFTRARGARQGMRGRGGQPRRQQQGTDVSDYHRNCTEDSESNKSDLSSMSDFFDLMHVGDENSLGCLPIKGKIASNVGGNMQFGSQYKKHGNFGPNSETFCLDSDILQQPSAFQSNPLDIGIKGIIVSVDESWGLVQVGKNNVHDFQANVVLLYGLKLEGVPLQKLFQEGQSVKVYLKGENVSILEYGTPQLPNQMRKAITTYCEMNSVPHNVRDMLEKIMLRFGI